MECLLGVVLGPGFTGRVRLSSWSLSRQKAGVKPGFLMRAGLGHRSQRTARPGCGQGQPRGVCLSSVFPTRAPTQARLCLLAGSPQLPAGEAQRMAVGMNEVVNE